MAELTLHCLPGRKIIMLQNISRSSFFGCLFLDHLSLALQEFTNPKFYFDKLYILIFKKGAFVKTKRYGHH